MQFLLLSLFLFISDCHSQQSIINYDALPTFSDSGYLHVVIEIPAGTNKKFEYDIVTNTFPINIVEGKERIINFVPYPGNYGFIPSTSMKKLEGGDGDSLDVLVLSEHMSVGTIMEVIPIAILHLIDGAEIDNKIIAVPANLNDQVVIASTYNQLNNNYPEVKKLLELWFLSYKGNGIVRSNGWGDEKKAKDEINKWRLVD